MVWTFDAWKVNSRNCNNNGVVDEKWHWFHGQCISEGQFFYGNCLQDYSDTVTAKECQWMVYKDADELLILEALFVEAGAMAVFSEWSATVSHYVSCVTKRPDPTVEVRANEVAFVMAVDAYVGKTRCNVW